jgi:hypothetical protein
MRAALALCCVLGSSVAAEAAELAPEGRIDSNFTWVMTPRTMDLSAGKQVQTAEMSLVVTAAATGSVLDKMVASCISSGETDTASGAFKMQGWCTFKDADGDAIYESVEESSPTFTATATGTGKLLGGTGKYAGITGDYKYTDDYFGELKPGTYGGFGHKTGSYRIVK